jgi:hypothetical protein
MLIIESKSGCSSASLGSSMVVCGEADNIPIWGFNRENRGSAEFP